MVIFRLLHLIPAFLAIGVRFGIELSKRLALVKTFISKGHLNDWCSFHSHSWQWISSLAVKFRSVCNLSLAHHTFLISLDVELRHFETINAGRCKLLYYFPLFATNYLFGVIFMQEKEG